MLQSEKSLLVDWDWNSLGYSYCFRYTDLFKGGQTLKYRYQSERNIIVDEETG